MKVTQGSRHFPNIDGLQKPPIPRYSYLFID